MPEIFADNLLSDRVILITGGGSGLGLSMAKRFASLGARVAITGRKAERLESAAAEIRVATEDDIRQALRNFADWIYDQLEKEYEYRMADEQVDDAILANEYEFTEAGAIA